MLESLFFPRFRVCIPQNKQIGQAGAQAPVHKILTFVIVEAEEGFILP